MVTNNIFASVEPTIDESYRYYDGPQFDTASIVLICLLVLSCCLCCFVRACEIGDPEGEYAQTSQNDIEDTMNTDDRKKKHNCAGLYFGLTLIPCLLIFGLGLNLMLRYGWDECSYDEDAKCGNQSDETYRLYDLILLQYLSEGSIVFIQQN